MTVTIDHDYYTNLYSLDTDVPSAQPFTPKDAHIPLSKEAIASLCDQFSAHLIKVQRLGNLPLALVIREEHRFDAIHVLFDLDSLNCFLNSAPGTLPSGEHLRRKILGTFRSMLLNGHLPLGFVSSGPNKTIWTDPWHWHMHNANVTQAQFDHAVQTAMDDQLAATREGREILEAHSFELLPFPEAPTTIC